MTNYKTNMRFIRIHVPFTNIRKRLWYNKLLLADLVKVAIFDIVLMLVGTVAILGIVYLGTMSTENEWQSEVQQQIETQSELYQDRIDMGESPIDAYNVIYGDKE